MATIRAIYENGVFRPTESVNLPERTEVDVVLPKPAAAAELSEHQKAIYEILGERYDSGDPGVATRHNEHQP